MKRYLLFDSSCSVCTDLAESIERESDGVLLGRSLYDPEYQALLARANAKWEFEPTLLEVDGDRVKSYTGLSMRWRLLSTLSPRRVYRIARIVQRAGVPLFGTALPEETTTEAGGERDSAVEKTAEKRSGSSHGFRMTSEGLALGATIPVEELTSITGASIHLSGETVQETLLVFLSTTCPACKRIAQALPSFADGAEERVVLVFGAIDPTKVEKFVAEYDLSRISIAISPKARTLFGVRGVPFGFAIDRAGVIRGKGVVNRHDHLEDLAHTLWFNVDTIQHLLSLSEERRASEPAPPSE